MGKPRGFSGNAEPIDLRWLLKAMPWPCTLQNILRGIDVSISNRATKRTHMRTNTERLWHDPSTLETLLRRVARVHSNHIMTGSCSLVLKNVEKRAPTSVHDALCQMVVLHHVGNLKSFNGYALIPFGIGFRRLEVMVTALAIDLQMRLRGTLGRDTSTMRAFLAAAQCALLAPECSLRGAIEAWVLHRVAFAVRQEGRESHINADVRMRTPRGHVVCLRQRFTDNEGIPVIIGVQDKIHGLRCSFKRTMQLDLERLAQLRWDDQMLVVFVQIGIFPILPQLDGVPLVAFLEAREPSLHGKCFPGEEPFEGLGESVGQGLDCCGRDVLTTTSFEASGEVILAWERLLVLILVLDRLQHFVIEQTRLTQAVYELVVLVGIGIKAVLKRSHPPILSHP